MKDQEYQALPMNRTDAALAYPLVYLHDASISLDAWLDFVARRAQADAADHGLIVIRDRAGIVHALFSHRVDLDLKSERQLCIAQLIVAQIPGSQIDRAVGAAAAQLAERLGCASITIEHPFRLHPVRPPTAA